MNQESRKIKKIIILGSGALKIGEAGEFDYSGSQAIKALKEEGIHTVLVNPNIATIQTSKHLADSVYFLPVTPFFVEKVIAKEKPEGILLSFGGQTALNCGLALEKKGILKKYNVQVLGTPVAAIELSEDRKAFAEHLRSLGISTPLSKAATSLKQGMSIAKELGFPVMVRAGFALGGQGSGICQNEHELKDLLANAFSFVTQVLIEQYLHHFKEVEYEVVRDKDDNCITVCNMENMDPLGIHTGESVVIAPSQTLTNFEYHKLRSISIQIVRSLKIVGECNVQFALRPKPQKVSKDEEVSNVSKGKRKKAFDTFDTFDTSDTSDTSDTFSSFDTSPIEYYVIELNARLSRSSALASKATGYPLAYVAAKLALGKSLTELKNKVTKVTQFCFEPALDYVTVKIPRWDLHKFKNAEESIGSSMKSVGEVMGIGRTFEESFQKAIRMLDLDFEGATDEKVFQNGKAAKIVTKELLEKPTPNRMFAIAKALSEGMSVSAINKLTGIDPWFLYRIQNIVEREKEIRKAYSSNEVRSSHRVKRDSNNKNGLDKDLLLSAKQLGISDKRIGQLTQKTGLEVRDIRKKLGVLPSVLQIDTLAGEFPAQTNYLYMTYNASHHDVLPVKKDGVMVLGSGPYRIGCSVEFDWSCVETVKRLQHHKKQAIVVNCNPETVSTDYDVSDRLYFEALTFELIADIYDFEQSAGIIVSVGGQTPNNRASALQAYGATILGTSPEDINRAEDRNTFSALLDKLEISQPAWAKLTDEKSALAFAKRVGYPILTRPSYVLSGSNMRVCHSQEELKKYIKDVAHISSEYPLTISKFVEEAKEIEVDSVAEKGVIKAFVVSEHIENAGVHSGDASIVFPAQKLYVETLRKLRNIATDLARELHITGPFNIQCLAKDNEVSVIEINLRASRTFPFISKVTGINFIEMATDTFFGKNVPAVDVSFFNYDFVATKVAQFSFARLTGADPELHVEMSSTGEVACFGEDQEEAFLKAELSVGGKIPEKGIFVSLGGEEHKGRFLDAARLLPSLGLPLYATDKTSKFLKKHGIQTKRLYKLHDKKTPTVVSYFLKGKIDLAINLTDPAHLRADIKDDYIIRRFMVDQNVPLFTNLQKAEAFLKAITSKKLETLPIKSWEEYVGK